MENEKVLRLFHRGVFYRAENTDAIVLSHATGYKLNKQKSGLLFCGFPEATIDKVLETLSQKRISHRAIWGGWRADWIFRGWHLQGAVF